MLNSGVINRPGGPRRVGVVTTSYPRDAGDPAGSFVAAHVNWLRRQGLFVDVVCAGDEERVHQQWQHGVEVIPVGQPTRLFYRGGAPDRLEGLSGDFKSTTPALHSSFRAFRNLLRSVYTTDSLCFLEGSKNAILPLCFSRTALEALYFSTSMLVAVMRRAHRWSAVFAHWLVPSALTFRLSQLLTIDPGTSIPMTAIAHSGDVHLICKLGIASLVTRILRARHTKIVFVSQALRRRFTASVRNHQLVTWLQHNAIVTPMGIDTAHFSRLQAPVSRADQPFHILFLGRLVPIKGLEILLQAISRLHSHRSHRTRALHLTVAGDGPSRSALEQSAASLTRARTISVEFVGEVATQRRDALLAEADVLVLPSIPRPNGRTEGTPVTALEAMASGTPVIASRTGGLNELPESVATLIPPNDPDALARALLRHQRDPTHSKQQAAAALRYVQRLDWDRVGPRLFSGFTDPTT